MLCQLSYARLQAAVDVPNVRPLSSARGASDTQRVAKYIAPLDRKASMEYTVAREASRGRTVPSGGPTSNLRNRAPDGTTAAG